MDRLLAVQAAHHALDNELLAASTGPRLLARAEARNAASCRWASSMMSGMAYPTGLAAARAVTNATYSSTAAHVAGMRRAS